jgi:hypothetical protein
MGWVQDSVAPASHLFPPKIPLTFPSTRPVTVGLHIRWGDTATMAVLLVGESSYGVLAHMIAPPGGVTVVEIKSGTM